MRLNMSRKLLPSNGGGAYLPLTLLLVTLVWWAAGRITAESRRPSVHEVPETEWAAMQEPHAWDEVDVFALPGDTARQHLKILVWNIAHGRGDVPEGGLSNWKGGTDDDRIVRLIHIADVLREVDADLVILNEVDFETQWSGHLNQGEILAVIALPPTSPRVPPEGGSRSTEGPTGGR